VFGELFRFSGTNWKKYTSGPGYSQFKAISIGPDNMKWFMTYSSGALSLQTESPVFIREAIEVPVGFHLGGTFPNPFNASTVIHFNLPESSRIELAIYDITGRKVRTLVSGPEKIGNHATVWDGRDDAGRPASSGIYLLRLAACKTVITRKMALVR
jgi:hypothetical protein